MEAGETEEIERETRRAHEARAERLVELEHELVEMHREAEERATEDSPGIDLDVDIPRVWLPTPVNGRIADIEKDGGTAELTVTVSDGTEQQFHLDWPAGPEEMTTNNDLIRLLELKDIQIDRFADLCGESVTLIPKNDSSSYRLSIPNANLPSRAIHRAFKPLFKYHFIRYKWVSGKGNRLRTTLFGGIVATILLGVSGVAAMTVGELLSLPGITPNLIVGGFLAFVASALILLLGVGYVLVVSIVNGAMEALDRWWPF